MTLHDFNVLMTKKLMSFSVPDPKPYIVIDEDGNSEVHANGWAQAVEMVNEVRRHGAEITEVNYVPRWKA